MGQKQKTEGKKVGNNNGQLRIANTTSGGACKASGPIRKAKVPENLKGSFLGHPVLIMTYQFSFYWGILI